MPTLMVALAVAALACWLSAAVHALKLVGLRRPELTAGQLIFQGHRFFDAATFKEEARPVHRRFLFSAGGFFLCILAALGSGLALAPR